MDARPRRPNGTFAPRDVERERQRFQAERRRRDAPTRKDGSLLNVTLDPLFDEYVNHLEFVKHRDPKTVSRNRYALARLTVYLDAAPAAEVDEETLEGYFAGLGLAASTIKTEVASVRAAYRYAARKRRVEAAPVFEFEAENGYDVEPKTYTNEQLRQIRDQICDDLGEAIFYLLAYTGCRRFEIVNLTWADVDFETRELRIIGKGKKLRRVPIHPVLLDVLQRRRAKHGDSGTVLGAGGSSRNVNQRLTALLKRAGVSGGNRPAHAIRKTVASVLIEEGARQNDVDKILGWAPPDVKGRYYVRTNPDLHETILKLYASDPIERRAETLRVVA